MINKPNDKCSQTVAADRQEVPECIVGQTGFGDPHAELGACHGRLESRQGIHRLQCKTQAPNEDH